MKTIFAILVAIVVGSVANAQEPCFDSTLNPYTLNSWPAVASDGNLLFVLQNPVRDTHPKLVVVIIHPMSGGIIRYGYLDGSKFRSYTITPETLCYKEDELPPEICDQMKQLILNLTKELQC